MSNHGVIFSGLQTIRRMYVYAKTATTAKPLPWRLAQCAGYLAISSLTELGLSRPHHHSEGGVQVRLGRPNRAGVATPGHQVKRETLIQNQLSQRHHTTGTGNTRHSATRNAEASRKRSVSSK